MRKTLIIFLLPFTLLAKPNPSETEPYGYIFNGTNLNADYSEYTSESGSPYKSGRFSGYVVGVVDTGDGTLFCLPSRFTVGQAVDIAGKYLIDNPERRHFSGARLVAEALSEHYPCKRPD